MRAWTFALVLVLGCKGATGAEIGEAATAAAVSGAALMAESAPGTASSGTETSNIDAVLDEPPRTSPLPFDLPHVRALLLEMNIRACWSGPGPLVPRDVQVTFRPNGTVVRVAVPHPRGLSTYDEECVARVLGDVIVDPFEGNDVVVGVTY